MLDVPVSEVSVKLDDVIVTELVSEVILCEVVTGGVDFANSVALVLSGEDVVITIGKL